VAFLHPLTIFDRKKLLYVGGAFFNRLANAHALTLSLCPISRFAASHVSSCHRIGPNSFFPPQIQAYLAT
jgi:hypothetical protein